MFGYDLSSSSMFIIFMVAIVVGAILWKIPYKEIVPFFKSKTGLGVLKGISLAVTFAILFALVGCTTGTYFNDASVFAGIDYTKKISPQCETGGYDDRLTSNVGLRGNGWQSDDKKVRINGKFTHHSCVLGIDDQGYDAVGVELEYKWWSR